MRTTPLNRKAILELAEVQAPVCVSLLMETAAKGQQARQNQIRFKNLVQQAQVSLEARNLRQEEIEKLLGPTEQLLVDTPFWSHQMEGLAVYLEGGRRRLYQLAFPVVDRVVVADRFQVKPLLKAATGENYYILNLNLSGVQLLECGPAGVTESAFEEVAASLEEAMAVKEYVSQLQLHSGAPAPGRGGRTAVYHGHGGGAQDVRQVALSEWLGAVARAVEGFLGADDRPLVLAGVDYVVGEYRKHDRYAHTLAVAVPGSHERKSARDLQRAGWEKVKGLFEQRLQREMERFQAGISAGLSVTGLEECLKAAGQGSVAHLLVADGVVQWGTYSAAGNGEVCRLDQQQPDAEELFERACLDTLRNGGEVSLLSPSSMPGEHQIAALLRFPSPTANSSRRTA